MVNRSSVERGMAVRAVFMDRSGCTTLGEGTVLRTADRPDGRWTMVVGFGLDGERSYTMPTACADYVLAVDGKRVAW